MNISPLRLFTLLLVFGSFTPFYARAQDPAENTPVSSNIPTPDAAPTPGKSRPQASSKSDGETPSQAAPSKTTPGDSTPDFARQEAAARDFATRYHPELVELLTRLRGSEPRQYRQAVQDLARTSDRLAALEKKLPDRHAQELKLWQVESRIRLLAARSSMTGDAELEQQLKSALKDRLELRKLALESERRRLRERLEKIDQTLARQESDPEALVDEEYARLKKKVPPVTSGKLRTKTKLRAKDQPAPDARDKAPIPAPGS